MKIQKLLKQYGEHGNEYSLIEVGDTLNNLLEAFKKGEEIEVEETPKVEKTEQVQAQPESKNKIVDGIFIDEKGGFCVRAPATGDKVYYVQEKVKKWVKNPETLFALGFNFSQIHNITNEQLDSYETGDSLDYKPQPKEEIRDANKYNI